jgi:Flp pilus assembly pilin Flp
MQFRISRCQTTFKKFALADGGHSITEYALMCALVAFGATAGYQGLAAGMASAYNTVSADFSGIFGSTDGNSLGGGKSAGYDGRGLGQDMHGGKSAGVEGGKNPPHGKAH